jgi:hypothetical protein
MPTRFAVLFFVVATTLSGGALAQTPRAAPRGPTLPSAATPGPPPSSRFQEPAAADQRGTDQAPLAVKIIPSPKSEAEAAQEQQDRDEAKTNQLWSAALTRALAIATGGLIVAIIGLWYMTARQSHTLKEAVDIARRSAESAEFAVKTMEATAAREQRAYVFVKAVAVQSEPIDRFVRRAICIALENTGATATRHLITSLNWAQFQPDIPADFHFPDGRQDPALLGPRQSMDIRLADIPTDALVNAEQDSHKLYVWGWAEYNDVFANTPRHRTEFCFRLLVHGDPASDQCRFGTSLHGKHNAADDDCSKKPSRHLI